ncbi:MAG: exosortase H [Candidatus Bipolaricaulota bacterium]|nr:exosortase H [Candidatus Bipolaricaulota bacterium]
MARKKHKHTQKEHLAVEKRFDHFVTTTVTRLHNCWQRNGVILRAWAVFAMMIALFTTLLLVLNLYTGFDAWLNVVTAQMLAVALWLLGAEGKAVGTIVTSKVFSAEIITECTAIFPLMIFLAAVIAYPSRWKQKLWGIVLGVPAILFVNLIRLVSLFYIGYWFPSVFETAHLLVWQSLIIFFAVLFWLVWVELFVHRGQVQRA